MDPDPDDPKTYESGSATLATGLVLSLSQLPAIEQPLIFPTMSEAFLKWEISGPRFVRNKLLDVLASADGHHNPNMIFMNLVMGTTISVYCELNPF
jgi:hypothetical protein